MKWKNRTWLQKNSNCISNKTCISLFSEWSRSLCKSPLVSNSSNIPRIIYQKQKRGKKNRSVHSRPLSFLFHDLFSLEQHSDAQFFGCLSLVSVSVWKQGRNVWAWRKHSMSVRVQVLTVTQFYSADFFLIFSNWYFQGNCQGLLKMAHAWVPFTDLYIPLSKGKHEKLKMCSNDQT